MGPYVLGLVTLGLTAGSLPLAFARWGPPSRVRRAVPALWTGMGVLVCIEALAGLEGVSDPHRMRLPTAGGWEHVVGIGVILGLVGLLQVRTRRELVTAAAPTVFAAVAWMIWPYSGDGWRLLHSEDPVPGAVYSADALHVRGDRPASELAALLEDGPVEVVVVSEVRTEFRYAGEERLRVKRELWEGTVRVSTRDSHVELDEPPIPLEGTIADVLAHCSLRCEVDLPEPPGHAAKEAAAQALLDALRTASREDPSRTAGIAEQLRTTFARTHAVMDDDIHELPWDTIGKPFETGELHWVTPRAYPDATLQIVEHVAVLHRKTPLYQASFEGRVSSWTRASRVDDPTRASLQAVAIDETLPKRFLRLPGKHDTRAYYVVVRDGIVEQVRSERPSPAEVRALVGIERAPRPPIPDRSSPFPPDACESGATAMPETVPDGCFAGRLGCGDTVFGPTSGPGRELAPEGGTEQSWAVEIPAHTIARLDIFACGTGRFEVGEVDSLRCPVPRDMDTATYGDSGPFGAHSAALYPGSHVVRVDATGADRPYALHVTCSAAPPGDQIDTGLPAGLYLE
ncbi:MAG: hypothetical protein H6737_06190 [Alphaproteobacteria bacterium]|nr:hypothetical protein [Alphaproteobacteria bacterium]